MCRAIAIVSLSVVMLGWSSTAAAGDENPQVTVFVYNDAGVPQPVLEHAEQITESIYQQSGVTIVWKDGTRASAGEPERSPQERSSQEAMFSLRIISCSLNLPGEDFGIAFVGNDGLGQQADVFYSMIQHMEGEGQFHTGAGRVLGHVMAHELGHLLLGLKSHSATGVMQARWTSNELHQISLGLLGFNARQSNLIRTRILGAYALRDNREAASRAGLTTVSLPPM